MGISVDQALAICDRVCREPEVRHLTSGILDPARFDRLSEVVAEILGVKAVSAIRESLMHLSGTKVEDGKFSREIWRLSANASVLRAGKSVPPWSGQSVPEKAGVQIVQMEMRADEKNELRAYVVLSVISGPAAGLRIKKRWSTKVCRVIARLAGFPPPWESPKYRNPLQLYGFRLPVILIPGKTGDVPDFAELIRNREGKRIASSSMLQHNRQLMRARRRRPGEFACPENFGPEVPCHGCHFGIDHCPAATHRQTYVRGRCRHCCKLDTWFDMSLSRDKCLECRGKKHDRS